VQLVSPPEAAVVDGEVPPSSDASPLGRQLVGRFVGETVRLRLGKGDDVNYEVKEFSY
jgi:transcription elongation factor GreA